MAKDVPNRGFEGGEGATAKDVERGYMKAGPGPGPERDPANYKMRWSQGPGEPNWEPPPPAAGERESDISFSMRERRSRGMLAREWPPVERN